MTTIAELINKKSSTREELHSSLRGIWIKDQALYLNYPHLDEAEREALSEEILSYFSMVTNILKDCQINGELHTIQNICFEEAKIGGYLSAHYIFTFSGLTQAQANRVNNEMDLAFANDDYGFDTFTQVTRGDITTITGTIA